MHRRSLYITILITIIITLIKIMIKHIQKNIYMVFAIHLVFFYRCHFFCRNLNLSRRLSGRSPVAVYHPVHETCAHENASFSSLDFILPAMRCDTWVNILYHSERRQSSIIIFRHFFSSFPFFRSHFGWTLWEHVKNNYKIYYHKLSRRLWNGNDEISAQNNGDTAKLMV